MWVNKSSFIYIRDIHRSHSSEPVLGDPCSSFFYIRDLSIEDSFSGGMNSTSLFTGHPFKRCLF